jgi:hypothetical protein
MHSVRPCEVSKICIYLSDIKTILKPALWCESEYEVEYVDS